MSEGGAASACPLCALAAAYKGQTNWATACSWRILPYNQATVVQTKQPVVAVVAVVVVDKCLVTLCDSSNHSAGIKISHKKVEQLTGVPSPARLGKKKKKNIYPRPSKRHVP